MPKPCRLLLCLLSFSRKYCCSSARSSAVISLPVKKRGLASECSVMTFVSSDASFCASIRLPPSRLFREDLRYLPCLPRRAILLHQPYPGPRSYEHRDLRLPELHGHHVRGSIPISLRV